MRCFRPFESTGDGPPASIIGPRAFADAASVPPEVRMIGGSVFFDRATPFARWIESFEPLRSEMIFGRTSPSCYSRGPLAVAATVPFELRDGKLGNGMSTGG